MGQHVGMTTECTLPTHLPETCSRFNSSEGLVDTLSSMVNFGDDGMLICGDCLVDVVHELCHAGGSFAAVPAVNPRSHCFRRITLSC